MKGEKYLTQFHFNNFPDSLPLNDSGRSIGERITKIDAIIISKINSIVVFYAKLLFINKYTLPWANGNPPSNAPTIYQYLKFISLHPHRTFILSANVPKPNVKTPIDHQSRCFSCFNR
jgi:hypothetical protein